MEVCNEDSNISYRHNTKCNTFKTQLLVHYLDLYIVRVISPPPQKNLNKAQNTFVLNKS